MSEKAELSMQARRAFLGKLAATCTGAAVGAGVLGAVQAQDAKSGNSAGGAPAGNVKAASTAAGGSFPTPDYDWTKHQWAFGVDATQCIGCLRCVEACKRENDVPGNAHQFRTWVERYVYLEGEEHVRIDSQQDPVNIEASGSQIATRMRRSTRPSSFPSCATSAPIRPACRYAPSARPTGPKTAWC